jgi:hypothetical protein
VMLFAPHSMVFTAMLPVKFNTDHSQHHCTAAACAGCASGMLLRRAAGALCADQYPASMLSVALLVVLRCRCHVLLVPL